MSRPMSREPSDDAGARMARLLLMIEAESFATGQPCPFCETVNPPSRPGALAHARDCELDAVLRECGTRSAFAKEGMPRLGRPLNREVLRLLLLRLGRA